MKKKEPRLTGTVFPAHSRGRKIATVYSLDPKQSQQARFLERYLNWQLSRPNIRAMFDACGLALCHQYMLTGVHPSDRDVLKVFRGMAARAIRVDNRAGM